MLLAVLVSFFLFMESHPALYPQQNKVGYKIQYLLIFHNLIINTTNCKATLYTFKIFALCPITFSTIRDAMLKK